MIKKIVNMQNCWDLNGFNALFGGWLVGLAAPKKSANPKS